MCIRSFASVTTDNPHAGDTKNKALEDVYIMAPINLGISASDSVAKSRLYLHKILVYLFIGK